MHIFLQGPRRVGKSTVIRNALEILQVGSSLSLGGFFTWNGGREDPHVYMRSAKQENENEIYRVASFKNNTVNLNCSIDVFEQEGVRILNESKEADLIIMDELGFLESNAQIFKQAVLDIIAGDIPVFGVLRLGDVPWHLAIKRNPSVTLYDVNKENRDALPQKLAAILYS